MGAHDHEVAQLWLLVVSQLRRPHAKLERGWFGCVILCECHLHRVVLGFLHRAEDHLSKRYLPLGEGPRLGES